MTERIDPPRVGSERDQLTGMLDYQRATLATKCDGLDLDQLRTRSVPPSNLSLLGLLRHMADVERWWFRMVFASEDLAYRFSSDENLDGEFDDVDTADADEAFAAWSEECELARAVVHAAELDDTATRPAAHGNPARVVSLRWILIHMIEEYARHNGHADLLRESIDGVVGD